MYSRAVPTCPLFFLLAFELQIMTKIHQNHEYFQIIFYNFFDNVNNGNKIKK
ncbi:hypothetical protein FWK35_00036941 [Aphis craccivora]|uniref:Uncharacterized protein n=1 Tax=Aphis craccivora TaxID=307492 RepID=A0A6G0Y3V9_APHCR|nr:hypothetical protein FWK35_00036941 [Aphis craccivora]